MTPSPAIAAASNGDVPPGRDPRLPSPVMAPVPRRLGPLLCVIPVKAGIHASLHARAAAVTAPTLPRVGEASIRGHAARSVMAGAPSFSRFCNESPRP